MIYQQHIESIIEENGMRIRGSRFLCVLLNTCFTFSTNEGRGKDRDNFIINVA